MCQNLRSSDHSGRLQRLKLSAPPGQSRVKTKNEDRTVETKEIESSIGACIDNLLENIFNVTTENFEETLETADIQKKFGIHDLLLNPQNIDDEQDAVDYLTIDLLSKKQDKHSNRRNRLFN